MEEASTSTVILIIVPAFDLFINLQVVQIEVSRCNGAAILTCSDCDYRGCVGRSYSGEVLRRDHVVSIVASVAYDQDGRSDIGFGFQ